MSNILEIQKRENDFVEFVKAYEQLCVRHDLQLVSEDPYCGLDIEEYTGKIYVDVKNYRNETCDRLTAERHNSQ